MKLQTLLEAGQAIEKQWQISPFYSENEFGAQREALKERLAGRLIECLSEDLASLINALYRLDIRERDFQAAMQGHSLPEIAVALAEIIIDREIEKATWREKYRNRQ